MLTKAQKTAFLELLGQVFKEKNLTGLSKEEMNATISDYLVANPIEGKTDEEVNALIDSYIVAHNIEHLTSAQVATMVADYWTAHPDVDRTDSEVNALIEAYVTNNPDKFTTKEELEAYTPENSGIVVNPRAITIQDGITEARIQEMMVEYIASIPNALKENSVVYRWNETRPAILGIDVLLNQNVSAKGTSIYDLSYASRKDWLFYPDYDNHNVEVMKGSDLSSVMTIDANLYGSSSTNLYGLSITPDAKRLAIIKYSQNEVNVLVLKDDLSGYILESTITIDTPYGVSIDGIGGTIAVAGNATKDVKIYTLSGGGAWELTHTHTDSDSVGQVELSKDGLICFYTILTKVAYIEKIDGVWQTTPTYIELPAGTASHQNKPLSLSLDKQVLYVGDPNYDGQINNGGKVEAFYKKDISVYSANPFGDGSLVHSYPLDGNATDIVGGVDGTVHGTITFEDAKFKQGAKTSNNGGISISENVFENDGSINIWVKPTVYKNDMTIFTTKDVDNNSQFVNTLYLLSDGKIQIAGRGSDGEAFTRYVTFDEVVPLNEFTMLTLTKTNSRLEIYKNGILVGGVDKTSFNTNSFETWMGYDSDSDCADGTIFDSFQTFNRVLSSKEVARLFNASIEDWEHKYTILPATPVDTGSFGVGVALNDDNSIAYIGDNQAAPIVWKYDIQVPTLTLDANSLDPFEDGSLKRFYTLDGNVTDLLTNKEGTVSAGTFKDGKFNQGGDIEAILNTDESEIYYNAVSIWVKRVDDVTSVVNLFSNYADSSGDGSSYNTGFNIDITTDNKISLHTYMKNNETITDSNGNDNGGTYARTSRSKDIAPINDWIHIVAVVTDKTDYLYINGELSSTVTSSQDRQISTGKRGDLSIGKWMSDTTEFNNLNGKAILDHLQIFDRDLTQDEVSKLYQAEVK